MIEAANLIFLDGRSVKLTPVERRAKKNARKRAWYARKQVELGRIIISKRPKAVSEKQRRDRLNASSRTYNLRHPDRKKASAKKWIEENPEAYREVVRVNRIPTDRKRATSRAWCRKNKSAVNKKALKWKNKKVKIDPEFALLEKLRGRIKGAIKNNGATSRPRTIELLGCSVREVRAHLEKQFLPEMSWLNHNIHGWHIDHIKPCSKFDLTDRTQQLACFHFTNLQPLWALDNIRKSNKIILSP